MNRPAVLALSELDLYLAPVKITVFLRLLVLVIGVDIVACDIFRVVVRIGGPAYELITGAEGLSCLRNKSVDSEEVLGLIYIFHGLICGNVADQLVVLEIGMILEVEAVIAFPGFHLVDEVYTAFILIDGDVLNLMLDCLLYPAVLDAVQPVGGFPLITVLPGLTTDFSTA